MQVDEAVKYHRKALDALSPSLFSSHSSSSCASFYSSSSSSVPSSSKGLEKYAKRLEKYVRTVSHGFIQQLAAENHGESAIGVFDDIHAALARYTAPSLSAIPSSATPLSQSNEASSPAESPSSLRRKGCSPPAHSPAHPKVPAITAATHIKEVQESLPMMYTSAIRYTVGSTAGSSRSLEQAQRIMDHQALHGVTPMWSCARCVQILSLPSPRNNVL